jgi:hypothetical protein
LSSRNLAADVSVNQKLDLTLDMRRVLFVLDQRKDAAAIADRRATKDIGTP